MNDRRKVIKSLKTTVGEISRIIDRFDQDKENYYCLEDFVESLESMILNLIRDLTRISFVLGDSRGKK